MKLEEEKKHSLTCVSLSHSAFGGTVRVRVKQLERREKIFTQ